MHSFREHLDWEWPTDGLYEHGDRPISVLQCGLKNGRWVPRWGRKGDFRLDRGVTDSVDYIEIKRNTLAVWYPRNCSAKTRTLQILRNSAKIGRFAARPAIGMLRNCRSPGSRPTRRHTGDTYFRSLFDLPVRWARQLSGWSASTDFILASLSASSGSESSSASSSGDRA
jgi:hypothetical protein